MNVFLAAPTYSGIRHDGSATGIRFCTRRHLVNVPPSKSSLMDRGMNVLWSMALEDHDRGRADLFAMIHSDVEPEMFWLDAYVEIMMHRGVDVVSGIIPCKEGTGRTSVAIDDPDDPIGVERVLTLDEVYNLPETFGAEVCPGRRLLVNNGLLLVDLRKPWCDDPSILWHTENRIDRIKQPDGSIRRIVRCYPQDWYFSRQVQRLGGTVAATRKVQIIHHGDGIYPNTTPWGEWKYDQEYATSPLKMPEKDIESMTDEDVRRLMTAPAPLG